MKGGVWYLSNVVLAIFTVFSVLFMLLTSAVNVFAQNAHVEVTVLGGVLHEEPRADNTLLAYMDTTHQGRSMAEWAARAMDAGSTKFSYKGEAIDLAELSGPLMEKLASDRAYTLSLEIEGTATTLATRGRITDDGNKAEAWVAAGDKLGKLVLEVTKR